jgi:eukaryotic-like serine/threonine-protein kinase
MPQTQSAESIGPDRDERLAAVLDELSRQSHPNIDAAAAAHPDLAGELRQLWAAAQLADAVARSTVPPGVPIPLAVAPQLRSFGDFEIASEIGRGGMGVVWRARQISLNRPVALKMVLRGELAGDSDRARFRGEAEAAGRLTHPNIVTVHEVGEHDGQPYFAMQLIEGPTLAQRLAHGPLPPRQAADLLAKVARAVDHAHRQGILHRDLKPSNILLDDAGEPHVTDFGLAKLSRESAALRSEDSTSRLNKTMSGTILGTPAYMAPEQAAGGKDLTPAADVYALGCILYEALTGRPPIQAPTPLDTLLLVLEQEPVPPRLLNPGVPRELEAVCLKCLSKSPASRYSSAADLAGDLEAYLRGDPVSAQSSGLAFFLDRTFRETHHAVVLEDWGVLWMWHSLWTLILCTITQVMAWQHVERHDAYLILWTVGLIGWGTIFWKLRKRAGPVRFVERQIAHAWAAGIAASIGMFLIEVLLHQPVLTFSPLLAVAAGMIFLFKAGVLAGLFYIASAAMFATAIFMALFPQVGILLFGIVTALCFFVPGFKYHLQRRKKIQNADFADRRG